MRIQTACLVLPIVAACTVATEIPEGAVVTCANNGDCPTGNTCSQQLERCIPVGQEDDPPGLELFAIDSILRDGTRVADIELFGVGTTVVVSFSADEPLGPDPAVTLRFPDADIEVARHGSSTDPYEYRHLVPDGAGEGRISLVIELVDQVGNPARVDFPNRIVIDTTPPGLGTVPPPAFDAESDNLQRFGVDSAKEGTRVEVAFSLLEEVAGRPQVDARLSATCDTGAPTVPLSLVTNENPFFVFEWTVELGVTDGDYTVCISATDLADNPTPAPLAAQAIMVDTTSPDAPVNLIFERVPWGAELHPEPVLMVRGTASIDAGDTLVIFDRADTSTGLELGRVTSDTGDIGDLPLNSSDRPRVFAVAVDPAGNESPPVLVDRGVWTASLKGKTIGDPFSNPHAFRSLESAEPVLFSGLASEPSTSLLEKLYQPDPDTGDADEDELTVIASRRWRQRRQTNPPALTGTAVAHIGSSGRTVVYGGFSDERLMGSMWEWNGVDWTEIDLTGTVNPGPVLMGAMTYDARRDRLVMFSGFSSFTALGENIWEWDGNTWVDATPTGDGPGGSMLSPMAYDVLRGRSVLIGVTTFPIDGLCPDGTPGSAGEMPLCMADETWEWDGARWHQRCDGTAEICANPPARHSHAAAFDTGSGVVVLHGGMTTDGTVMADTWTWDGTTWTDVSDIGGPGARFGASMVFNPTLGTVMLFGGCRDGALFECNDGEDFADLWTFNGSGWDQVTTQEPPPRCFAAAAFDTARQELVLLGGRSVIYYGSPPCPGDCPDGSVPDGDMDDDPVDCECVHQRTWLWSGDGNQDWRLAATPSALPDVQANGDAVYDADRQKSVVFGGNDWAARDCDGSGEEICPTLWEWDGTVWVEAYRADTTCSAGPCGRELHAMTTTGGGEVLLFGGQDRSIVGCSGLCTDTWLWDGASWRLHNVGGPPPGRNEAAMVTAVDPGTGEAVVYLFGGRDVRDSGTEICSGGTIDPDGAGTDEEKLCTFDDLWAWTESGGWVQLTPSGSTPQARFEHRMAFDPIHNQLVLYGGCWAGGGEYNCRDVGHADGHAALAETWVWDPVPWADLTSDLNVNRWTLKSPATSPPPRAGFGLAYDSGRARLLLFGGSEYDGGGGNDVWEWDGTTWAQHVQRGVLPPVRRGVRTTYDAARRQLLLLGGGAAGEVWEWDLDPDLKPTGTFEIAWDASGVLDPDDPTFARTVVDRILVTIIADGLGFDVDTDPTDDGNIEGEPIAGVVIEGWDNVAVTWTALPCDATSGRISCDLATGVDAQRFLFGGTNRLYLRLIPIGGSGNGPAPAQLDIDYGEVRVEYTWPE